MAHKLAWPKITLENCHNNASCLTEVVFGGRHERKIEAIGEHNLSIVGGNWEGIIGDRLSRQA